jgi:hypothetical protein
MSDPPARLKARKKKKKIRKKVTSQGIGPIPLVSKKKKGK